MYNGSCLRHKNAGCLRQRFPVRAGVGAIQMDTKDQSLSRALRDAVILIPSLEPDERLPAYIRKLADGGFGHIVVVDDGSPEAYQRIFQEIALIDSRVQVLHHEVNRGKGVALKTGYRWIQEHLPDISGVITADADGQHTVPDCVHLAEELEKGKRALYLGSRDFSLENVPPKSRTGNRITSVLFLLLYGKWLQDTQTGLRAFRKEDLSFMTGVEGDRFEYEMNVLIACATSDLPMIPITIETVYENENRGTHYHPLKDSLRIFRVIIRGFVKFMGVSLLCFLVDQLLFNVLNLFVFRNRAAKLAKYILISTAAARVVSAGMNFTLNRNLVFHAKGNTGTELWKYVLLAVSAMILSAGGVWLLGQAGMNSTVAKLIVDFLLYFLNYRVQQKWVFGEKRTK